MKPGMLERSLPALFKKAGYRTGIIGKLHVNPQKKFPFDYRPRVNTRQVAAVAHAAGTFIGDDPEAAPFFLVVNYTDPHAARDDRHKLIHNLLAGTARPPAGIDGDPTHRLAAGEAYANTPAQTAFATFQNPPELELYDLEADPHELNDLATDPSKAGVIGSLKAALGAWRERTADPFLAPAALAEEQSTVRH